MEENQAIDTQHPANWTEYSAERNQILLDWRERIERTVQCLSPQRVHTIFVDKVDYGKGGWGNIR